MPNMVSDKMFFGGGIIAGLIFVLMYFAAGMMGFTGSTERTLILCVGIALILGAFGSQASVKYQGVTMSGAAAIALIFVYYLTVIAKDPITYGYISGDVGNSQIEVIGDENYLGGFRNDEFSFVVLGEKISKSSVKVKITFLNDITRDNDDEIFIFRNVASEHINSLVGSGRPVEWEFVKAESKLYKKGESRTEIDYYGFGVALASNRGSDDSSSSTSWSLIPLAYAADSKRKYQDISKDLGSGSLYSQTKATDDLVAGGINLVSDMIKTLRDDAVPKRVKRGVMVGLAEVLRVEKNQATQISSQLTDDDLSMLVRFLNDSDRTMRIHAGEFLYDLEDQRVVDKVLVLLNSPEATDEGKYLAVFIISNVYPKLEGASKTRADTELLAAKSLVKEKTGKLIDSIVARQQAIELFSGSYSGQWKSKDADAGGNLIIDLSAEENGKVVANYSLNGSSYIDKGQLVGKISYDPIKGWNTRLAGNDLKVDLTLDDDKVVGVYAYRFGWFNLFKDDGSWQAQKQ